MPTVTDALDYIASPQLELIGPGGNVLATSRGNTHGIDRGSSTTLDPFLEYSITQTGTYLVRVSSWIDYAPSTRYLGVTNTFRTDETTGVVTGQSYDLVVSLGRHEVNGNAISLAGKLITIVEGTGKGQTAMIESYKAESKTYVLDRIWAVAPDATSKFEISEILSSSTGYRPVTDTYDVVLTGAPSAPVIINVTPEPTRTYDSAQAFDPAADYGEANLVQVLAATPRALYQLNGAVRAGDVWSVTLRDVSSLQEISFQYTATATDTLATITAGLIAAVNNHVGYAASLSGTNGFVVTRTSPFAISLSAPAGSSGGETHVIGAGGNSVAIQLSGTVVAARLWTLTLDGQAYQYTTVAGDTIAKVATGLAAAINGHLGYTASADAAGKINVNREDSFFATYKITPDSAGNAEVCFAKATCTSDFLNAHWPTGTTTDGTTALIHLTGEATQGETWSLTLPTPFSYTAQSGDTAASVAAGLVAAINSAAIGYHATLGTGGALTLTKNDGSSFTGGLTSGAGSYVTTPYTANITPTGTTSLFKTWTLSLDGAQFNFIGGFSYTLANVAAGLAASINANVAAGFHATVSGATIAVTKNGGSAFTATFLTSTGNIVTTPFTATATVAGAITAGSTWTLTVNATFSYTTGFGDDLATIARHLGTSLPAAIFDVAVIGRTITVSRVDAGPMSGAAVSISTKSPGSMSVTAQLAFTAANWNIAQTVTVMAVDDHIVDGSDALVFPPMSDRVNEIRGPVNVDGGIQVSAEPFLNNPLTLPGETNFQIPDGPISSSGAVGTLALTKQDGTSFTGFFGAGTGTVVGATGATGYIALATVGPNVVGKTWSLILGATTYSYTGKAGDTLFSVAASLAAAINAGSAGYHATLETDGTLTLTKPVSATFAASFTTPGTGTGTISATDNAAGHIVSATPTGTITVGKVWTLKLDTKAYSYTAKSGDSLTSIGAALAKSVNDDYAGGFHATVSGATLTLTKPVSATFTSSFGVGTGSVVATDGAQGHIATATLTAPVLAGETWTLMLDGAPFTYTAVAGDTLGKVAAGLAADVNDGVGFVATNARAAATITDGAATHVTAQFGERPGFDPRMNDFAYTATFLQPGGASIRLDVGSVTSDILSVASSTPIPVSFSLTGTSGAVAAQFIGTPDQSQLGSIHWSQATVALTGAATVGEIWTLKLDDTTFSVTVNTANAVPSRIAQQLADQILQAGYAVEVRVGLLGDSKLIVAAKGSAFTAVFAIVKAPDTADTAGVGTVSGVTTEVAGHTWTNAAIQLLTRGAVGNVWSLTLNGTTLSTTVRADDTIGDIAHRLANAVAGNDLTKAYLPLVSGSQIVFASDWPTGLQPAAGTDYFISPAEPQLPRPRGRPGRHAERLQQQQPVERHRRPHGEHDHRARHGRQHRRRRPDHPGRDHVREPRGAERQPRLRQQRLHDPDHARRLDDGHQRQGQRHDQRHHGRRPHERRDRARATTRSPSRTRASSTRSPAC